MPFRRARFNWDEINLVVFDMDGTLYDQRKLRALMLGALIAEAIRNRSLDTMLTLRAFRRAREQLAVSSAGDFLDAQYAIPATWRGHPEARVRALVAEWMEQRPLPLLAACRRPGVARLFGAIRGRGKKIGIFSDYPATEKLAALGLRADYVVSSTDLDVGRLKPDPTGLYKLICLAAVEPQRAVLIGDRIDRDSEVAARANMHALILSPRRHETVDCFSSFSDGLFEPLLRGLSAELFGAEARRTV
jgi:FMN phosphatase YigB (HAD superfamily)